MKPICALGVCESLTASVEILVQFLDLLRSILVTLTADVGSRLCEEISVLETFCMGISNQPIFEKRFLS